MALRDPLERPAGQAIEHQITDRLNRNRLLCRTAAQQRANPSQHFREGERLDQVVVRSAIQADVRSSRLSRAVSISTGVSTRRARSADTSCNPSRQALERSATKTRKHQTKPVHCSYFRTFVASQSFSDICRPRFCRADS